MKDTAVTGIQSKGGQKSIISLGSSNKSAVKRKAANVIANHILLSTIGILMVLLCNVFIASRMYYQGVNVYVFTMWLGNEYIFDIYDKCTI